MREIKFRAWSPENKEIIYFDNKKAAKDRYIAEHLMMLMANEHYAGKDLLMQYTGLKDKNGVEIYEGDIVKCYWLAELGITEIDCFHTGIIRFVDCRFEVSFSDRAYIRNVCEDGVYSVTELELTCCSYDEDCHLEYEVIGNIYENPDLLEGK